MRPDQTATEFSQHQPLLVTPLSDVSQRAPHRQLGLFARVTFCFAWLFGLEPFLTGAADDQSPAALDRR
ncbi:hypothetical protein [Paraburkholderia dilworthii]|uniref:hypothetical protein n=1 Tax=Paraburkholderia dilworthii TaxID=948106 RepID=UPI0004139AB0|nr:hypothetical protein [Paraburkholderia dilworthii]